MVQKYYQPPRFLKNGFLNTVYTAWFAANNWQKTLNYTEPIYQEIIFQGASNIPIYGLGAIPENAKGTIIGTYGITGTLENQWFLKILSCLAFTNNYAVILFDWRAHGETAKLSSTLTSDGIYEGKDFIYIASQAKKMGYPTPFWFTGYSLGGQLALWGIKEAQTINDEENSLDLIESDIGGGAVICPSLDSNRSLDYLIKDKFGKYIEKSITKNLINIAWELHRYYPDEIDPEAIKRVNSIRSFDDELVIKQLGFSTTEEYYNACSPLPFLPHLKKPTLILYAIDDPMFAPSIIVDLKLACQNNPNLELVLTQYGGHVGYISSVACQQQLGDPNPWWAWNRVLEWIGEQEILIKNYK
ncbi:esterase [Aphanothece hegewaldii CCALA 016]|uniref:Esterase n=2 Tax=Aphanothece TaxID=1121 RepID=A0A2T1LXG2_9CHRO|nr:esterase [Aphanothece hegewaldii CCALA 016]